MPHPTPLVIVEGFLGSGHRFIWGDFERHLRGESSLARRVIFVKVGSVSSLHDRACELFYALMGGTVDYGDKHSQEHKHKRYGRTHLEPLYPQWSAAHPLHFLGHSMGGATITKLQHLIKTGHFGPSVDCDMFRSITSVSSPFRGTQTVYLCGSRVDAAPLVRPISFGNILSKVVHIGAYLSPLLPDYIDPWHLEHRSLSCTETSFLDLLKNLVQTSDLATSRDVTPWDATFIAADERDANLEGEPHPNTFYRSFAAVMTQRSEHVNYDHHKPSIGYCTSMHYYLLSSLAGTFDFNAISPRPSFLQRHVEEKHGDGSVLNDPSQRLGEEYWANDGVAPLFSQWHPLDCSPTRCRHHGTVVPQSQKALHSVQDPGIWHVHELSDTTHTSLLPLWVSASHQKAFWRDQGRWMSEIDELQSYRA